ncbi:MAG: PQQ-binding-like beta-propeller repeat protein [bacterium]
MPKHFWSNSRGPLAWVMLSVGLSGISASLAHGQSTSELANWPSFRGFHASGVADGQNLPDTWNGETGENVRWKTKIPGLAHSSPVVWENRIFVTSAISSMGEATFRSGLYGDGTASTDRSVHKWLVYCLDKVTGEVVWQRVAAEGKPKDKRHIKATYANSSPATDGKSVVALFGSEGLYAFDVQGNAIWQKDLGRLNMGAYDAPSYEWGSASSPIIHGNLVFVQCDTQNESFVIACDLATGETVWKTMRDELPSWGTPTILPGKDRTELVTNSANYIRSYDPLTGRELWRLGGSSKITAPTPIFTDDLIIVASGRRPEKPIFAIRPGARGDITLADQQTSNDFVAWSKTGRGPYMPTPLIYDDYLYALNNNGVFDCYDLRTGAEIYRQRIRHAGGGFSASPVAADGKLYLPAEDGDIFVVKAGPGYKQLAVNSMGELLMATPALSSGMMIVRAKEHLFAIGK